MEEAESFVSVSCNAAVSNHAAHPSYLFFLQSISTLKQSSFSVDLK